MLSVYGLLLKCQQVCKSREPLATEAFSLQRNVNGNMDSAKYQSDIIHDIEMTRECVVILQKGYIFMHDLSPCHGSKSTRIFLDCKQIPIHE